MGDDGKAYTKQEFIDYYGGTVEWEANRTTSAMQGTQITMSKEEFPSLEPVSTQQSSRQTESVPQTAQRVETPQAVVQSSLPQKKQKKKKNRKKKNKKKAPLDGIFLDDPDEARKKAERQKRQTSLHGRGQTRAVLFKNAQQQELKEDTS